MAPCGERGSRNAIQFQDSPFGVILVQDCLALGEADEQAIETDAVELAGDAVAELVGGGDEGVGEGAAVEADDAQVVFDVGGGFLQVEGLDVVADVDTLVEGFEALELEEVAQVGLAEEDEGEGGGGIHVGIEPETEFVEQAVAEEVGLVDDDDGLRAVLGEVGQGSTEALAEAAGVEGRADVEGGEEVGEEGLDGEVGVGQIGGEEEGGIEGVDEGAHGGGLAGTDVAGDEGGEVVVEGEGEAGLDLLMGDGGEEVAHGEGLVEGQA